MNKKKILIFSSNQNKIKEIKKIINNKNFKIYTLKNFKKIKSPNENGKSFTDNAKIKSKFGYKIFQIPCIADDSGISINALNGKPGIHSGRFLKKLGSRKKALKKIINLVSKKKDKLAFFTSVISFTYKKNKTVNFKGVVRGSISKKPMGKNGFGYDPIFIPNKSLKTYAQMRKDKKNKLSHRKLAINKLNQFFKNYNSFN